MIRRMILFDNQCGFALGENSRAPNPYVTWRFNEQDGHRNYFWGHYMNEPDMAERDLLNRAEDYQRRYHVQEVEQAPDKETYLYYSTQRPIDIGTYPNSYFNRPVHMDLYFTRQQVTGEAFQAWGAIRTMSSAPPVITWIFGGRWTPRPRWWENGRTLTASRIKSG